MGVTAGCILRAPKEMWTGAWTVPAAVNLGALVGAAIVQLHAAGWATRWEPVGTPGGSSLVGRLWLGTRPD